MSQSQEGITLREHNQFQRLTLLDRFYNFSLDDCTTLGLFWTEEQICTYSS